MHVAPVAFVPVETLPSVEIIIPTRDNMELLRQCLQSITTKNKYKNVKITVIDNDSAHPDTLAYFETLSTIGIALKYFGGEFNYSAMCNQAASDSEADYLLFLNNDVRVLTDDWLQSMVSHAISSEQPIVGKRLLYPDGKIQHAGVAIGLNGIVSHPFSRSAVTSSGGDNLCYLVSAVTFACVLVKRDLLTNIGGLDERLKVGLNDVDFCLRAEEIGVPVVLCGEGEVIHHESATRPKAFSPRGIIRASLETYRFAKKWKYRALSDGYFEYR